MSTALILPIVIVGLAAVSCLGGCVALWLRVRRDGKLDAFARCLALGAGALPLISWVVLDFSPPLSFSGSLFAFGWAAGIIVGLLSLLVRVPRRAQAVFAGISTGCVLAFAGAIALRMLRYYAGY